MRKLCLALAVAVTPLPALAQEGRCAVQATFDKAARLTAGEVGGIAEPSSRPVGDYVLVADAFRPERRPVRNGMSGLGVVGVSAGAGGPDLAGVLWTRTPEAFGAAPLTIVANETTGRIEAHASNGCGVVWKMEVNARGEVLADGKTVGSLAQ